MDYRNLFDLRELADMLRNVPVRQRAETASFIIDHKLMRPQWYLRILFWLIALRVGSTAIMWQQITDTHPAITDSLIQQTATWLVHGKDLRAADAAGGFNQKEIDLIHNFLISM